MKLHAPTLLNVPQRLQQIAHTGQEGKIRASSSGPICSTLPAPPRTEDERRLLFAEHPVPG